MRRLAVVFAFLAAFRRPGFRLTKSKDRNCCKFISEVYKFAKLVSGVDKRLKETTPRNQLEQETRNNL